MKCKCPFTLLKCIPVALFAILLLFHSIPESFGSFFVSNQETQKVVAGDKYEASGIHRWFLGKDYRDLWTMPIEVEVLDLQTYSGGSRSHRVSGRGE